MAIDPTRGRRPAYYPGRSKKRESADEKKPKQGKTPQEILRALDQKVFKKLADFHTKLWEAGVKDLPEWYDDKLMQVLKWFSKEERKAHEQIKRIKK
jgi:hypothetical protein